MGETHIGWYFASGTAILAFMTLVALRGGLFLFALLPLLLVTAFMVEIAWIGRRIAKRLADVDPNNLSRSRYSFGPFIILTFIAIGFAFFAGIISAEGMQQNKMPTVKTLTKVNFRQTR